MDETKSAARFNPLGALLQCLRFYSRLPVPVLPGEGDPHRIPDFRTVPRMIGPAGLIIGLLPALTLCIFAILGLPALATAFLALGVSMMVTGAFHEDGIADMADGFGGGATPARRLEIMTDSRIGTFGGVALVVSTGLRAALLAGLLDFTGPIAAALVFLAFSAWSRAVGLMPLSLLKPAKPDGKSAAVGEPTRATLMIALILACGIAAPLLLAAGFSVTRVMLSLMVGLAIAVAINAWSKKMIDGQTGDVAGGITLLAEISGLIVLSLA
jgi:adenosylcobinamide-GDP ribazoletransferase